MTLDEARENIGAAVVYDAGHRNKQDGTIVQVADHSPYVMVRYGHNDSSIRATPADKLTLLSESFR